MDWIDIGVDPEELLDLDEALTRFEAIDPKRAQLVKLRFFAGLTVPEAAEAMGVSRATAERYLENFSSIRLVHDFVLEQAEAHDVPLIDNSEPEPPVFTDIVSTGAQGANLRPSRMSFTSSG